MSLDVWLELDDHVSEPGSGIFIRENGLMRQISREEWDERMSGVEPVTYLAPASNEVYEANITHNLNEMAKAAGIYRELWRPDELGITKAKQLIQPLERGLFLLIQEPEHFEQFNPPNGWGDYRGLVNFVMEYLWACKRYPDATIGISR